MAAIGKAEVVRVDDLKATYSAIDKFVVEDCTRYAGWIRDNPRLAPRYRSPKSMVFDVINNLYAAIACRDPKADWWPRGFALPAEAPTWKEDLLHRSISDLAMAEAVLISAKSCAKFETG